MFDKGKQWWRDRKIQEHFQNNKDLYTGIAIGGVSVWILKDVLHSTHAAQITNNVIPTFNNAPVFNNDNSSIVNFGGSMSKIVKCLETGEIWETVKEAAASMDVDSSKMSRHLNNHMDHVNGKHFEIIGVRTSG